MRLRSWVVGAALGALVAATQASPAAATHAPFYGYMGIIEITSSPLGVSYTFSGFAPTNWSGGCSIPDPYGPFPDITTTVVCTPPAPPQGFDVNYCLTSVVNVSTTAPTGAPGTVDGSSTCEGLGATAQANSTTRSGVGVMRLASLAASFPWRCQATAPPTMQQWSVRCALTH